MRRLVTLALAALSIAVGVGGLVRHRAGGRVLLVIGARHGIHTYDIPLAVLVVAGAWLGYLALAPGGD
jgi:hypothetical protein